jgi:hypothetical protein
MCPMNSILSILLTTQNLYRGNNSTINHPKQKHDYGMQNKNLSDNTFEKEQEFIKKQCIQH